MGMGINPLFSLLRGCNVRLLFSFYPGHGLEIG